jgi:microcystin-dependent protein
MDVRSQLKNAQLESRGSAPTKRGEIVLNTGASNQAQYHDGSSNRTVVNTDQAQALTNKTVVVANNTITTAASGNLAATELNAALSELQSDIDTRETITNVNSGLALKVDKSTLTTKGDIYVASAASTVTRLPAGTNGYALVADNTDPLGLKFESVAALTGASPTGVLLDYFGSTAPTGYVLAGGKTIGSGSSGGTERANADTQALFILLWTDYSNTILPIQDSSGTLTTRGASALADFSANKRLPLPDLRGRAAIGKDDMGGTSANRITAAGAGFDGDVLGASGGAETHQLTTAQMPSHTHTQNAHSHSYDYPTQATVTTGGFANGGHHPQTAGTSGSTTATNQNTGGDGLHNNTQPSWVVNKIIKL